MNEDQGITATDLDYLFPKIDSHLSAWQVERFIEEGKAILAKYGDLVKAARDAAYNDRTDDQKNLLSFSYLIDGCETAHVNLLKPSAFGVTWDSNKYKLSTHNGYVLCESYNYATIESFLSGYQFCELVMDPASRTR